MSRLREAGMRAVAMLKDGYPTNIQLGTVRSALACNLRSVSTLSSDLQQPSTSGQDIVTGWLGREIKPGKKKDPPLSWMYMREGPDGVKRFMPWSERLIWGTVFGGIAFFFGPRIYKARQQAAQEREAAQRREAELTEKRLVAARVLLSGKSWVHDESEPFEGMTPKQIVEFIRTHSINPEDPFEGMSPEEIDEFVRKTGIEG